MGLHHEFEFVADKHLAQTCAAGSGDEGGFAGIQFSVLLVAGLLALFCPAGDWKMATIAEFSFIGHLDGSAFSALLLSGKMCRFLQRAAATRPLELIGVLWKLDRTPRARAPQSNRRNPATQFVTSVFQ
jgi:hypothetical protein